MLSVPLKKKLKKNEKESKFSSPLPLSIPAKPRSSISDSQK